ncbi:Glycyl-glycine endopeptidase lytM precursor [Chryseobacterium gleum]|uniref:Glycyl-glycine endopeptidase lytM n=2 Tax=Chryseobacterium gleum TaxID=250 RepID=A0A3S4R1G9_CHRGE|nr:peptidase, M23 family [Chryseobacterium gleum ATCC 35910]VEE11990.1 Glycyl-glycine endopeptidase lytM precursor [Chryseobacterium gleum]
MTGTITGNQNPLAGTTYSYEVKPSLLSFGLKGEYEWYLYKKQKNGTWKDITGKPKTGEKVTYRFGEIALGIEFQMKVYEIKKAILPGLPASKELAGTLILIPTSNKVSKIDKVVLFNRGAANVNKASYRDTLIAQAHCIGMFNKEIEFHLWEDDAPGKGHDPVINKNNRHTRSYKALVNAKGIAEVQIPLMSDEKILRQIANQFMMKGDKSEGANHEYYVTASYSGQIQGASQVNVDVANPDYKGQSQNQPKPQPQGHTPKFTPGQKAPKQPDPKGNIIEAVFIDDKGNELSKVAVGDKVRVRIHSKNMVGKHIQYVVWEYDTTSNDEVYRSGNIKIPADVCDTSGFVITKDIFDKGIDSPIGDPDSDKQNYFIEIISKDLSAESQKFGVNPEGLMQVEKLKSAAAVQNTQKPDQPGSCICQEQYKDLVWGGKVSCEFRKKVVQICAELWGENRKMEMANGLMAVMNVETASSFKAHQIMGQTLKNVKAITKDDFWLVQKDKKTGKEVRTSRAVGLIQFTQSALQAIGEFKSGSGFDKLHEVKLRFATMGEIKQLDYVKKYFEPSKNKIKTPEDIYLHVFAPKGVNQSDNYVLYEKGTIEYTQNESVDKKSKGANKGDGKIQRSEILERYHDSYNDGITNKTQKFNCNNSPETPDVKESSKCPEDCSQCFEYSDVIDNPKLNDQSNNVNKNRFHRTPRYNNKHPKGYYHTGTDILAQLDKELKSLLCGEVVEALDTKGDLGKIVTIKSKDKNGKFIWIRYCHLNSFSVSKGQKIKHGKIFGKSGNTGNAKDILPQYYHVHIEASTDGVFYGGTTRVDPEQFMKTKFDETIKGNHIK